MKSVALLTEKMLDPFLSERLYRDLSLAGLKAEEVRHHKNTGIAGELRDIDYLITDVCECVYRDIIHAGHNLKFVAVIPRDLNGNSVKSVYTLDRSQNGGAAGIEAIIGRFVELHEMNPWIMASLEVAEYERQQISQSKP